MKIWVPICCFTFFVHFLNAQSWVRQHPFAGFAPLHAITFDDNGRGWAVGQQSLIMHTPDWGDTWSVQSGLPIGYTFEAVEIIPGTNAQVVLAGGPGLFITRNGGELWEFMHLPLGLDGVFRIQAFDELHWMAFGFSKGIKTSDGGQTWQYIDMPGDRGNGTWFNDMNTGWTGSGPFNEYQLYKTTNGGIDWTLADDAMYPVITDITMIDALTGFMSARDFIFKTTDGGASWTPLHDDVQPGLNKMHVVNESIIWSSLNNGFVFFTTNGGQDWSQVNPNLVNSNQVFDVYAIADGRAWVPGKYASVQHTTDTGLTWEDQTPGTKNSLFDVKFIDDTGIAVGSDGALLLTTNNGAIWQPVGFNPLQTYLTTSLFKGNNEDHVYLGTTSGEVLHSTLENLQWETIGSSLGDISTLHAVSDQVLLAGTFNSIVRTANGGTSWETVATTSYFVGEFAFPNPQTGYAAVQDGRILKSTDGGQSWQPALIRDNTYRFSGLHFHDTLLGWAVAEFKDSVFITQDGGISWSTHALPTNTFWQDIQFMDRDTGYISGGSSGSGTILRTTDGGETWTYSFYESERLNRMYVRPGEDYVWVVGFGGNILHLSPCAASPTISDLAGDTNPCADDIAVYQVDAAGATIFNWTLPDGWTIVGNDNSALIEVLVGPGSGAITIQAGNTCGVLTATLSLDVESRATADVAVTESSGTIMTSLTGVTYQWLLEGETIAGADQSAYTPVISGNYSLLVTFPNGCTRVSNELFVMVTSIQHLQQHRLQIFPNPSAETILWFADIPETIVSCLIYDMKGQLIMEVKNVTLPIDIAALPTGMYVMRMMAASASYVGKFVRS